MIGKQVHDIPGYDYGTAQVPRSPVTLDDLGRLKRTAGFDDEDHRHIAMAAEVLVARAEAMVDVWRTRIGEQDHLWKWFAGPDGNPDEHYKAAVKPRFVQWVKDVCLRGYDQSWLDYQEEIARRHTPEKKNLTDGVEAPPLVPLRYLLSFTAVIVITARDFLARSGNSPEQVQRMHAAWTKAVLLTLALWARPYTKDGLW